MMLLERLIFPKSNVEHKNMFFRGNDSSLISKEGSLSFDTYYNSFSYTKYCDYTNARDVTFKADFSGRANVQLCVYDGEEHIISECEAGGTVEITIPFEGLPKNGFLYPKFTALTDCEIYNGGYYSDCSSREINCCIAICTYKREQFVLKNIEFLRNSKLSFVNRVFVIDNGQTLDFDGLSDGFINVLPNKNYGGSGGFTRGLIEAYDGGFSHVILMDDDIEFYPEIIERMTIFLSILKGQHSKVHISTAMLPTGNPYFQYEAGAKWNGKYIQHLGHNIDTNDRDDLLKNLSNPMPDYGAWWCFCLPVSDIEKNNLPYPFFIKIDDAEYGVRNLAEGDIVTMNGIAVYHEDFNKKYSIHLEYYNIRNQLVFNAVHQKNSFFTAIYRLIASGMKHLMLYRYDAMPLIFKAADDFLKGTDFFINAEDDKLNSEIMKMGLKTIPLESIKEWNTGKCVFPIQKNGMKLNLLLVLTLGGHLIPYPFMKKDIVCKPLPEIEPRDCLGFKKTIQYQCGSPEGLVFERNCRKFFKYFGKLLCVIIKTAFKYSKVKKDYCTNKSRITSMDFWKKRLGI